MKKEIAFLIELNDVSKSGLYYATVSKIKYFKKYNSNNFNVTIFNIGVKQPNVIRKIYSFFKLKRYPDVVDFDGLKVKQLYLKIGLIDYLLVKLGFNYSSDNDYTLISTSMFRKFNIISAHYTGPMKLAYHIFRKENIPFTLTFHGSDINRTPFKSDESKKFYSLLLNESSANLFVSKALKLKAETITKKQVNNHVLYNGIDSSKFNKLNINLVLSFKQKLQIQTKKVVGFVGNLVDVKNVMLLPEIFSKIKNQYNDVSFIILGDGVKRNDLKVKLNQQNLQISYLDRVNRDDINKFYSIMDVLVLPSKSEGLPMVLLEALASNVHCVASDVGGISELIGKENTVPFKENFIDIFVEKVVHKLNESKYSNPIISKEFNLDYTALKEAEVYNSILNKN